jgi:hypothetical protein
VYNLKIVNVDNSGGAGDGNGPELLTNGNFESGAEAWTLPNGDPATIVTEDNNAFFQVDVTAANPTEPFQVNLSQGMTLIPDTSYVVSFKAKAAVTRTMLAGLGLNADPFHSATETVALTTEWETYTYTLSTLNDTDGTPFGDDISRVLFDMGAEVGMVSIDDVSVKVEGAGEGASCDIASNLLTNCNFDDLATSWTADDTSIVAGGFYEVDVTAAGNPWDVNLSQVMTLVPDATYVLSFKAKSIGKIKRHFS